MIIPEFRRTNVADPVLNLDTGYVSRADFEPPRLIF